MNSLISRYSLDADIHEALKKSKWSIDSYRIAVMSYRNAENKEQKREMERLIQSIKTDFETEVKTKDKRLLHLKKLNGDLFNLTQQTSMFEKTKKELTDWNKKVTDITTKIKKLETELEEIKNNKIYENAFEWRFEFPEVLNDEGDFVGFDMVIGNPPYISAWEMHENDESQRPIIKSNYDPNSTLLKGHWDLYIAFILHGLKIGKKKSSLTYIIPNPFLREKYAAPIREYLLQAADIRSITLFEDSNVFDEVARRTIIIDIIGNMKSENEISINQTDSVNHQIIFKSTVSKDKWLNSSDNRFNVNANNSVLGLLEKIDKNSYHLGSLCYVNYGAQVSSKEKGGYSKSDVVSIVQKGNAKRFIEGKDVHKWHVGYRGLWLDYREFEMYGPRFPELFENEKIVIRKISDRKHRIAASLDFNKNYTDDGCVIAIPYELLKEKKLFEDEMFGYKTKLTKYSLEYFLSQLLCSVSTFYFKNKFSTESLQGETSHTYPRSVRELPVYNAMVQETINLSEVVIRILSAKKSNPLADTITLENEIDQLVYQLYGLTEEEIKIIEQSI